MMLNQQTLKISLITVVACMLSACGSSSSDPQPVAQLSGVWQPKGVVCDQQPANAVQSKSEQSVSITNTTISNTGSGSGRQNIASNSAGCNGSTTSSGSQIVSFNGQSVNGDSVQPLVGEQKQDGAVSVPVDAAKAGCVGSTKTARVVYVKAD